MGGISFLIGPGIGSILSLLSLVLLGKGLPRPNTSFKTLSYPLPLSPFVADKVCPYIPRGGQFLPILIQIRTDNNLQDGFDTKELLLLRAAHGDRHSGLHRHPPCGPFDGAEHLTPPRSRILLGGVC